MKAVEEGFVLENHQEEKKTKTKSKKWINILPITRIISRNIKDSIKVSNGIKLLCRNIRI
jgi:histone H3/H4